MANTSTTKTYLGDSVYLELVQSIEHKSNFRLTLFLDNGMGTKNEIVMEPEVVDALIGFLKRNKIIE